MGLLKMTVYRPFPFDEIFKAAKNAKALAIAERNISPGFGGAVYADTAGLYANVDQAGKPMLLDYIVGLGGRDVMVEDFFTVVEKAEKALKEGGPPRMAEWIDVTWDNLPEDVKEEGTGSGWSKEVFK